MVSYTRSRRPTIHVEIFNRELKWMLEKTMNASMKDWSKKLDDALWTYRTTFKTTIGMLPYWLGFGKACHFPVEMKHHAYWAIKKLNFDFQAAGKKWLLQLNEIDEFCQEAYESARIYKEHTKKLHNKHILKRDLVPGQKALLYNSRLHLFLGKLCSQWSRPFIVVQVFPHDAVEIQSEDMKFKVNNQRLNAYIDGGMELHKSTITLSKPN